MKQGYKWIGLITTAILSWALLTFAILPLINFLFLSTKDSSVLENALNTFIPEGISIKDINANTELMLTSWDLNNRSPRFFSKWSYDNLNKNDDLDHSMDLRKMTLATSATPYYFTPADIEGNFYISGDNIAMSPAMFAYLYANEKKNIERKDIRVVSVGATNEASEKLDSTTSLLEWVFRLPTLLAPVKKHTQDFMLQYFLREDGKDFHKYELQTTRKFETEFYLQTSRVNTLKTLSQDMIF